VLSVSTSATCRFDTSSSVHQLYCFFFFFWHIRCVYANTRSDRRDELISGFTSFIIIVIKILSYVNYVYVAICIMYCAFVFLFLFSPYVNYCNRVIFVMCRLSTFSFSFYSFSLSYRRHVVHKYCFHSRLATIFCSKPRFVMCYVFSHFDRPLWLTWFLTLSSSCVANGTWIFVVSSWWCSIARTRVQLIFFIVPSLLLTEPGTVA
jgi:hypothetical protein